MDFNKFIQHIYEMGDVVITITTAYTISENNQKKIGRVNEYEFGIEILFDDDSTLWIDKSQITAIEYDQSEIWFRFSNKDTICFANV